MATMDHQPEQESPPLSPDVYDDNGRDVNSPSPEEDISMLDSPEDQDQDNSQSMLDDSPSSASAVTNNNDNHDLLMAHLHDTSAGHPSTIRSIAARCQECRDRHYRCHFLGDNAAILKVSVVLAGCDACRKSNRNCSYRNDGLEDGNPPPRFVERKTRRNKIGPRKRAGGNCTECKRRKIRCLHTPGSLIAAAQAAAARGQSQSHGTASSSATSSASAAMKLESPGGLRSVNGHVGVPPVNGINHQHQPPALPKSVNGRTPLPSFDADTPTRQLPLPQATRAGEIPTYESFGAWNTIVPRGGGAAGGAGGRSHHGHTNQLPPSRSHVTPKAAAPMLERLPLLLTDEYLTTLPPPQDLDILSEIYVGTIHPQLPLVEQVRLKPGRNTSASAAEVVLLQQGICLAASKNRAASAHLRISGGGRDRDEKVYTPHAFGQKMTRAMRLAIDTGIVTESSVILTAMVLLAQFGVADDAMPHLQSQMCVRAVVLAHALGIGMHRGRKSKSTDHTRNTQHDTILISSIWATDRLNSMLNGVPLMMRKKDLPVDFEAEFAHMNPSFRLLLGVVRYLERALEVFRARSDGDRTALMADLPSFEELVEREGGGCDGEDGSQVGMTALATLKLLYHTIVILTARNPASDVAHDHGNHKDLGCRSPSTLGVRLDNSLTAIYTTSQSDLHGLVINLPWVPHALVLALGVVYREMRGSQEGNDAKAKSMFKGFVSTLSDLECTREGLCEVIDLSGKLVQAMSAGGSHVAETEGVKDERNGHANGSDHNALPNGHAASEHTHGHKSNNEAGSTSFVNSIDPRFDLQGFEDRLQACIWPGRSLWLL